jgi:putative ATP-dependent endonuclease of OLD family
MYISKICLNNFRNFKKKEIEFKEGTNVIIGHNNAGKTNLLKALALVLDFQGSKRLVVDDFSKKNELTSLKTTPPKVSIELTIKGKDDPNSPDDLVTVSNWLTVLGAEYEAVLTYEFFLPEKEKSEKKYVETLAAAITEKEAWKFIQHDFLRYYTYKIWGGKIENQTTADSESLQKFDFQFLDAIRDVERDMFSGKNTLLRDVMNYFLDFEEKEELKKQNKIDFANQIKPIIENLQKRLKKGKEQIQSYTESTGASFHEKAKPDFDGSISEQDIFSALRLIIRYDKGIDIPVSHNGLGYNNLIFMSLLLAKMQADTSKDYMSSNAKVFSILSIEEPEAHLHPAMQYKFLKFLAENKKDNKVRQIFITTHSTHITSAVKLDDIICLHNREGETLVGYPGKVFPTPDIKNSKKYVQRFLDATKSDMLFAQKVILVEGLAEQLLFSTLAKYAGFSLEDNHIAVIGVAGRYFNHFLHLFDKKANQNAIPKKIVCITDRDPTHKKKSGGKFRKCYPFEYNQDPVNYEYKDNASSLISKYETHSTIRFYSQDAVLGKTFEYDLILQNPKLRLLVTEGMSNQEEIKTMMSFCDTKTIANFLDKLPKETNGKPNSENIRIKNGIEALGASLSDVDKKKSIVAARYLNSIGKGENALDLAVALEENLEGIYSKTGNYCHIFKTPQYIKDAIEWLIKPL